MELDLKQLRCGECGGSDHELFLRPTGEIITQCCKCLSQSLIEISKPEITIKNLGGQGTLCVF